MIFVEQAGNSIEGKKADHKTGAPIGESGKSE